MLTEEYTTLAFFILTNLALPFYRKTTTFNVIIYISSLIILYASFLFHANMRDIAAIIYFTSSLFFSIRQNTYFIYIMFVNIFICYIVINGSLYGYSIENFRMLFPPDVYEYLNIVNMISDVADMALSFMVIGGILFLVSKTILFIYKKKQKGV